METKYYSKELCEQLAQELLKEKAEMVKLEASVENLTKLIFEAKKEVIGRTVLYKWFKIWGKTFVLVAPKFEYSDGYINVSATFAAEPGNDGVNEECLTAEEAKVYSDYKAAFKIRNTDNNSEKLIRAASRLSVMNKGINLIRHRSWVIGIDDCVNKGFFKESGLYVKEDGLGSPYVKLEKKEEY